MADGGDTQANAVVHLVGTDSRLLSAVAIALSVLAAFYSWQVSVEEQRKVYWDQRIEGFIEELSFHGVPVPKDILDHIKEEHKK